MVEKTKHFEDRESRNQFIKENIGFGKVIDKFYWDRGHKNGAEVHCLYESGVIAIYNYRTKKLITYLIARPQQVRRYYEMNNKPITEEVEAVILKARQHQEKGWNEV